MTAKLIFGAALAAVMAVFFGGAFLVSDGPAKRRLLPGKTSDGHAQLELACSTCHTPFEGVKPSACLACHAAGLDAENDSHPESKFADPRNAQRAARLDARDCSTCHAEHAERRTDRAGLTRPRDFCVTCHADVGEERPDHQGFAPAGCTATGCHNFHDNRDTNEDFLAKHLGEPALLDPRPKAQPAKSHLAAEVSCARCHGTPFVSRPADGCATCHAREHESLGAGKHGMRAAAGLAPMTTSLARRPMLTGARTLGCTSCHDPHENDTKEAATAACLACHADDHSRSFTASPHARAGLACATCHLPGADHDQNRNLRPVTKMVTSVCSGCHGVGFALDALADPELTRRSFAGTPSTHVKSMDMAAERAARKENGQK